MTASNKESKKYIYCMIIILNLFVLRFVGCNRTVELAESTSAIANDNSTVVDVTTIVSTPIVPIGHSTQGDDELEECLLSAVDPLLHNTIQQLIKDKVSLIEYRLKFANYTLNPLTTNVSWLYSGDKWSRVTTSHGQVNNISTIIACR